jgi:hypothetical protein
MRFHGVCYDAGTRYDEISSRRCWDADLVEREIEAIRSELHCSSILVFGSALDRIVAVDHYRGAYNEASYVSQLRALTRLGKPVVVAEFGCCAYAGADQRGGAGAEIVSWTPYPHLDDPPQRSESTQARYLVELLEIFQAAGVHEACVFSVRRAGVSTRCRPAWTSTARSSRSSGRCARTRRVPTPRTGSSPSWRSTPSLPTTPPTAATAEPQPPGTR